MLRGNVLSETAGPHTGITVVALLLPSATLVAVTVQLTGEMKLGVTFVGTAVEILHIPPAAGAVTTWGAPVVAALASVHPPVVLHRTAIFDVPCTFAYNDRTEPGIAA